MRHLILAALLLLPVGCSSYDTFDLDPKWEPLEQISERPDMLGSDTQATTIGHTVYVEDLDKWLLERPVGSPRFDAILLHEQVHSVRQLDAGVTVWLAQYLTDTDFMWEEERIGWYEQLRELQRRGARVDVGGVARTLHNYRNLRGRMVSYQDALQWVNDVIAGRWTP